MIDRLTTVQWAKDAGVVKSVVMSDIWLGTPEQLQALINRAIAHGKQQAEQDVAELVESATSLVKCLKRQNWPSLQTTEYSKELLNRVEAALAKHGGV